MSVACLESWGGDDDWVFSFEPEVRAPPPPSVSFQPGTADQDSDPEPVLRHRGASSRPVSTMSQMSTSDSSSSIRSSLPEPQLLKVSQVRTPGNVLSVSVCSLFRT